MDEVAPEAYEKQLYLDRARNRYLENYLGFLKGCGGFLAVMFGSQLPPENIFYFSGLTSDPFVGGLASVIIYSLVVWVVALGEPYEFLFLHSAFDRWEYERLRTPYLERNLGFLKACGGVLAFMLGLGLPSGSPIFFVVHLAESAETRKIHGVDPVLGGLGGVVLYFLVIWVSERVYRRRYLL